MTPVSKVILDALSTGIKAEVAAYVFYITAGKMEIAEPFKEVLDKMAYEEKEHFHILERQHDSLVRSEKWISTTDILKEEGLPEIPEDMMTTHKLLIEEIENAKTVQDVLEIAYRLEEDAFNCYNREMDKIKSEDGKKIFNQLAKFEQGHMRMVKDLMQKYA